jgi:hypothetical protein
MEKRIGHRAVGKLAAAAAVGLVGVNVSQSDGALVIDIRATHVNGVPVAADSRENVVIAPVAGTVVSFEVVAAVTGTDGLDNEGFQSFIASFRTPTGGLLGDLATQVVAPFNGSGSANGTQLDPDADTDFDIGPNANSGTAGGYFNPRSAEYTRSGTRVGTDTEEFVLGTGTWTMKESTGSETFIDFIRRRNPGNPGSNNTAYSQWQEDGSGTSSVRNGASPYSVDGLQIVVPEPSGIALAGLASIGLLGRRRNKNA